MKRTIRDILLVILFCGYSVLPTYGQDGLQSIYDHIMSGQLTNAERELDTFEQESNPNDTMQIDIFYLRGLMLEQKGDNDSAMSYYSECCNRAEATDFKDVTYLDALMRIMLLQFHNEDFEGCANTGMRALKTPTEVLELYPASSHLFSVLATAMSHLRKFAEVPKIAQKGEPYIHRHFTPKDESYYEFANVRSHCLFDDGENRKG